MIAILVDDEGAVQVLPLDRREAKRADAVLLKQAKRYLEVPYSTWREFLGRTARLAEMLARPSAQWPLEDLDPPAGTGRCPTGASDGGTSCGPLWNGPPCDVRHAAGCGFRSGTEP